METNEVKIGDKALLFKLKSYNAGTIDLAELIGDQKIVLIFSRYFGCPICQLDFKTLLERKHEIEENGAKILYITQSSEKVAKEYIEKEKIDFPVILSSKDELYADYGLGLMTKEAVSQIPLKIKEIRKFGFQHGEYEGWEKQSPGQFVVDEQGRVIHALKGWLDIDKLLAVL